MVEPLTSSGLHQGWPAKAKSYELVTAIGMGSFGLVWKAKCIEGPNKGKDVAIKVVDLEQF
jgi:serine/threonine-protein kinase OSR1/STK39